jgi:hypothetical protein
MNVTDSPKSKFLVEWYQREPATASTQDAAARLAHASATAGVTDPPSATLTLLVTVPSDQTLFAVFSAAEVDDVIRLCDEAGWPADRISSDVEAWVEGAVSR